MAKRSSIEIIDQERAFEIDELFFSITDKKGIIKRCNDVFTRISAYETDEVIGAPHSILRHPDMPRVVFQLLWKTIEAGQTIAAYVKNLAKDGRYYWVLAVVMPTENGYLSIRLKPSSTLFPIVKDIYSQLLKLEKSIETEAKRRPEAMAASAELLSSLLKSHGFRDYTTFMHAALSMEMMARVQGITQRPESRLSGSSDSFHGHSSGNLQTVIQHCGALDGNLQKLFKYLDEFREMSVLLLGKSKTMLENAAVIRLLSLNATITASRLGARAQTLGVVAQSLGEASVDSEQVIVRMTKEMDSLVSVLSGLIFEVATIKLQSEVSNHFLQEMSQSSERHPTNDLLDSLNTLVRQIGCRIAAVYERLNESGQCFSILRKRVEMLLRNVNTLRFVQFAGLKESVALDGASAFAVVFEEAKIQIEKTRAECDELWERVDTNQKHIRAIQNARGQVTEHTDALLRWADSIHSDGSRYTPAISSHHLGKALPVSASPDGASDNVSNGDMLSSMISVMHSTVLN